MVLMIYVFGRDYIVADTVEVSNDDEDMGYTYAVQLSLDGYILSPHSEKTLYQFEGGVGAGFGSDGHERNSTIPEVDEANTITSTCGMGRRFGGHLIEKNALC